MTTAGAISADFLHNFTFVVLLRPAMRGSTPDPTGGAARRGDPNQRVSTHPTGAANRDQGVTEPTLARAVSPDGVAERAVSSYAGRLNAAESGSGRKGTAP